MSKLLLMLIPVGLYILVALSPPTKEIKLQRSYEVAGIYPDGKVSYKGQVALKNSGGTYQVAWHVNGQVAVVGTGILSEDKFAVTFLSAPFSDMRPGIAIFKVESDGTLDGRWSLLGRDATGIELWIPEAVEK